MTKYVLNFGDSWAHAADVKQHNGYAALVARTLGVEMIDYSIHSTSIHRMVLQFQKFLKEKYNPEDQYLALFFVTAVERMTMFDENQQPYDIWPQSFEDFYSKWYTNSYGEFAANTSLITLQSMCKSRSIEDVYMLGWQNPELWSDVNREKFIDHANTCIVNQFGGHGPNPLLDMMRQADNTYLLEDNWHPNIEGHKFIADLILRHLKLDR